MDKCVATFPKNKFEEIRVQIKEFKGYDLIDIRVFASAKDGENKVPTGKGVSINITHFNELKKSILDVETELRAGNLLSE
ncbi:MAG: hypothetical protein ACI9CF_000343 [Candidatus Omnitrophota bacterium]|jgi:hypothetical protein